MNKLSAFSVPVAGLDPGKHDYTFLLDKEFFAMFEYAEIKKGIFHIKVLLYKETSTITLHLAFDGSVNVSCDRCTSFFDMPLEFKETLYVNLGEEEIDESNEVITVSPDANQLDLSSYFYELIHIHLPHRKVHPVEVGELTCDPKMLKKLEALKVPSRRNDAEGNDEVIDPRWEALKKLKL